MTQHCNELPEDCWATIFSLLEDHNDRTSLSSVCKNFLYVSNQYQNTLSIINPSLKLLSNHLQRFPNLKKINLQGIQSKDMGDALGVIAESESGLILEELDLGSHQLEDSFFIRLKELSRTMMMKNLKVLHCQDSWLSDSDLGIIADSLPNLHELRINKTKYLVGKSGRAGNIITDEGISVLSSKLKRLRKINVSGNYFISDQSLVSLSSNCKSLTDVEAVGCSSFSQEGICSMMEDIPNLKSLVLGRNGEFSSRGLKNPDSFRTRFLSRLEFSYMTVSDDFLYAIVESHMPLKNLGLSWCKKFTFAGLSAILYAYQSLESLALERVHFLTDESVEKLSKYIQKVTSLNLNYCTALTDSSFITITRTCARLNRLEMKATSIGKQGGGYLTTELPINRQIISVNLGMNDYLTTECLKMLLHISPNLQLLDVSSCFQTTELSIPDILNTCPHIKDLKVMNCHRLKYDEEEDHITAPKLRCFSAAMSGINDHVLRMIANRCPGLVYLNLMNCLRVTTQGVKAVGEACVRLREIDLGCCSRLEKGIVDYMVALRPSLKRLVSPCSSYPTVAQRRCFMEHGCLVELVSETV